MTGIKETKPKTPRKTEKEVWIVRGDGEKNTKEGVKMLEKISENPQRTWG